MAAPMVLGTNRKRRQRTFWLNKNQQQRAAYTNSTASQKSDLRSATKVAHGAAVGYGAMSTKVARGAERVNNPSGPASKHSSIV